MKVNYKSPLKLYSICNRILRFVFFIQEKLKFSKVDLNLYPLQRILIERSSFTFYHPFCSGISPSVL